MRVLKGAQGRVFVHESGADSAFFGIKDLVLLAALVPPLASCKVKRASD